MVKKDEKNTELHKNNKDETLSILEKYLISCTDWITNDVNFHKETFRDCRTKGSGVNYDIQPLKNVSRREENLFYLVKQAFPGHKEIKAPPTAKYDVILTLYNCNL